MIKVYCVNEVHLCEDMHYQGPSRTVALYAHEKDALAAVAEYEQECKRQYAQDDDYEELWDLFPKRYVLAAKVNQGESK